MSKTQKGTGIRTLRSLNGAQVYKLNCWLVENVDKIQNLTRLQIAEMAQHYLGFEISPSSVTNGIENTGIEVISKRSPVNNHEKHRVRMNILIGTIEQLCYQTDLEFPRALTVWKKQLTGG